MTLYMASVCIAITN